jgi:hypothetical protein
VFTMAAHGSFRERTRADVKVARDRGDEHCGVTCVISSHLQRFYTYIYTYTHTY